MKVTSSPAQEGSFKLLPLYDLQRSTLPVATAMLDEADFVWLHHHRWSLSAQGYAYRADTLLHRLLVGAQVGELVDHINRDQLDNRRLNLRICNAAQNVMNRAEPQGANPHRGVCWSKCNKRWQVYISVNGKRKSLGTFAVLQEAISVRVSAEKEYFGAFAPVR